MAPFQTPKKLDFFPPNEEIIFAGNPLDRLDDFRKNKAWVKSKLASRDSNFLIFYEGKPLMKIDPELGLGIFSSEDVLPLIKAGSHWVLLGGYEGTIWFACEMEHENQTPQGEGYKFIDVRSVANQFEAGGLDEGKSAIIGYAASMLGWHKSHGFCAKCGQKTIMKRAGFIRSCVNENCRAEHFPRTDPVVIMLALKGDKCLLGRSPHFMPKVYSALAGFMEPGETIEEGVRRELMEEVGIRAGKVTYLKSQPWPFPSSLMIGCMAEALNENIILQDGELEDARWFSKIEIEKMLKIKSKPLIKAPTKIAIAYHLMACWVKEK